MKTDYIIEYINMTHAEDMTEMIVEEDCYTWLFGVKYANELKFLGKT